MSLDFTYSAVVTCCANGFSRRVEPHSIDVTLMTFEPHHTLASTAVPNTGSAVTALRVQCVGGECELWCVWGVRAKWETRGVTVRIGSVHVECVHVESEEMMLRFQQQHIYTQSDSEIKAHLCSVDPRKFHVAQITMSYIHTCKQYILQFLVCINM